MVKVISQRRGFLSVFAAGLLLVGATGVRSDTSKECGVRHLPAISLLLNAVEAKPGDWPWHVAIFEGPENKPSYICGGSIISINFVLTAAHCFREPDPARYFFRVGVHQLSASPSGDVATYQLYQIIPHPKYSPRTYYNDIALIRSNGTIALAIGSISKICVWSEERAGSIDVFKAQAIAVGFGFNENHTITDTLHQASMAVIEKQQCIERMPAHVRYLPNDEGKLCAIGSKHGSGVCSGDSGGGLYFAKNSVWFLRGIVSAAARKDLDNGLTTCDTSLPATYTDVSKYTDWIAAREQILEDRNLLNLPTCGTVRNTGEANEAARPVFNQYPWNVLLEFREENKGHTHLVCSGVLVHPRLVLTVGHCTDGILNGFKLASVRLGEFNLRTAEDTDPGAPHSKTTTQSIEVVQVIRHPQLNTPMYSNDLALLKLKHNADMSKPNIEPICLPSLDDYKESSLTLSGWKRNKYVFPKLERDLMNITSTSVCLDEYKKMGVTLPATDDIVCAVHRSRPAGNCNNYATGSPLQYIKVVDRMPRYYLAGLMVLNFPFCRTNGSELFVNLNSASDWIKAEKQKLA